MSSNATVQPIPLTGGLNVAVNSQQIAPGECTELINYELTTTGRYQRVAGYERCDGTKAPSSVVATELPGYPFATPEDAIAALKAGRLARRDEILTVPGSGPVLGVLIFKGVLYAFRNNAGGTAAKMHKATATGWQEVTTPALQPSGRYQFVETNFTGAAGTIEVIGVDGKNPAFRFNGTTLTQIASIIAPDQPIHCEVLPSQVLLLAFRGGSFLFSSVGDPTKFSAVDGGGEIAVGQEITGLQVQADNTCAVFTRNRTYILYGTSKEDFQLKALALRSGCIDGTLQSMGNAVYLDDRGLTRLDRVQNFGDFDSAAISQKVQPLLLSKVLNTRCSMALRTKNQYRLFFGDSTALCLTMFGSEVMGFSELRYNFVANCAFSGEDSNGGELFYVGADDGYVYQLERGNSFDGTAYSSTLQTGFMSFGRPEDKKRWRKLVVEADSVTRLDAQYRTYYDYTDPNIPLSAIMIGSGSKWDLSDWDLATWGGASTSWTDLYLDGVSRSISVYMATSSDYYPPHILSQLFLHASPRGRRR
jgi:hypothetical protein